MISLPDFKSKQIVFVFFNDGEKLSFSNDNIVVKDKNGKTKLQTSCYNVFMVFAIGSFTLTSVVIDKAHKFNFFIALMTFSFRLSELLGKGKDGNVLLKSKQYNYNNIEIAKHIVKNKITNQKNALTNIRRKSEDCKNAISSLKGYITKLDNIKNFEELLAYEGLSAKLYFKHFFDNVDWKGRQPRLKRDYINSVLDIGYTLLFSYIEAILLSHGFDIYCGVLHKQFYMRKSLVCDIIEPFRILIDSEIKKSINLNQIKEDDFTIINGQYKLRYEHNSKYVMLFVRAISDNKENIFKYIQQFYRKFMKGDSVKKFPQYINGVVCYDND